MKSLGIINSLGCQHRKCLQPEVAPHTFQFPVWHIYSPPWELNLLWFHLPPVYSALNYPSEAPSSPNSPHRTILFTLTYFIPLLADDQSRRSVTRHGKLKENPTCELNVFSLCHLFTLKFALTNSIKLLWSRNDKRYIYLLAVPGFNH